MLKLADRVTLRIWIRDTLGTKLNVNRSVYCARKYVLTYISTIAYISRPILSIPLALPPPP